MPVPAPAPLANDLLKAIGQRWMAAMRAGDFETAWCQTDRIEIPRRCGCSIPNAGQLIWDGTPFTGKRVLVRCNHGLGDTIQFVRFLPQIAPHARQVVFMAQPLLLDLLKGQTALGEICNDWAPGACLAHDCEIEIMELAYAVRATAQSLPQPPYLERAEITRRSSLRLTTASSRRRLRFGLIWAASDWDESRSIPFSELLALHQIGAEFVSLQQGAHADDWKTGGLSVEPLADRTRSILDLAMALLCLDALITVDTMAAHLAGALDLPCAILLQYSADWRWGSDLHKTVWYPKARLFRQPNPGDWSSAVAALGTWLSARRPPHANRIPVNC